MPFFLFVVVSLFSCVSAWADSSFRPAFGDTVIYQGTDSNRAAFERRQVLKAYDPSMDRYELAVYKLRAGGREKFLGYLHKDKDVLHRLYISDLSSECAALQGTLRSVQVPAGIFDACVTERIDVLQGEEFHTTTWLAAGVPFGVVKKSVLKAGDTNPYSVELKTFQRK
jgi:hypothetical protein